uniref:(California timema) hypothetical protein n=1 Tax=Timema californicum TaxID=61474 RepID=A0A7R9JGD1_TIMCA|nr:unnamed protein product [Timema californicum]
MVVGEGPTPCQMLDNGADQDGETRGQGSVLGTMASPGFRESHIVKLDKLLTRWMFMNAWRKHLKALMFVSPLRVIVSWKPWDLFAEPCLITTDLEHEVNFLSFGSSFVLEESLGLRDRQTSFGLNDSVQSRTSLCKDSVIKDQATFSQIKRALPHLPHNVERLLVLKRQLNHQEPINKYETDSTLRGFHCAPFPSLSPSTLDFASVTSGRDDSK